MSEDALLTGPLESSNEAYAVAKIAGMRMCEAYHRQYGCDFRSVMPTNLYGPNDNFDLESSHVLPALLRKFHEAVQQNQASVTVWGSGLPRREFLHVDDMAAASYQVMRIDEAEFWALVPASNSQVNIGCGEDVSIAELAELVATVCGFTGEIVFDRSKPDGSPRKLLDVTRARTLGWSATIPLLGGVQRTYAWMRSQLATEHPGVVGGQRAE
jgi:nucleoside-diphosphate-sugar epimerase